jgi:hypothetical protein
VIVLWSEQPLVKGKRLELQEIMYFSDQWRNVLMERSKNGNRAFPLSSDTIKQIAKRVAPSVLPSYLDIEKAIDLLMMELQTIGTRIVQYRYIGVYNSHFHSPSPEIGIAFLSHFHSLRVNELYIVLERGSDFLRFCELIAEDLELPSLHKVKSYIKSFKKIFERRLRERHRIVHAHERPSLASRLLELPPGMDRDQVTDAIVPLSVQLMSLWFLLNGKPVPEQITKEDFDAFRAEMMELHLNAFDQEAREMWDLFSCHFQGAFGVCVPV